MFQNLVDKVRTFFQWLGRQPILEPVLELLHYQRTLVLAAGAISFKLLPTMFSDMPTWLQQVIAVFLAAMFLGLFAGLQKEVWIEAQKSIETLPKTLEEYGRELADIILRVVLANRSPAPTVTTHTEVPES